MIKDISHSRHQYNQAYRYLRVNGGTLYEDFPYGYFNEAQDCAVLSFDYHDSDFSGWINRQRRARWKDRMSDPNMPWGMPF